MKTGVALLIFIFILSFAIASECSDKEGLCIHSKYGKVPSGYELSEYGCDLGTTETCYIKKENAKPCDDLGGICVEWSGGVHAQFGFNEIDGLCDDYRRIICLEADKSQGFYLCENGCGYKEKCYDHSDVVDKMVCSLRYNYGSGTDSPTEIYGFLPQKEDGEYCANDSQCLNYCVGNVPYARCQELGFFKRVLHWLF